MINQFSWIGASEREDGSPYLPEERRGYDASIRPAADVGESPDNYLVFTSTEPSPSNDYTMPYGLLGNPLTEGDWIFVVRDVDKDGRMSAWSADYEFSVVITRPKPPTGLSAS